MSIRIICFLCLSISGLSGCAQPIIPEQISENEREPVDKNAAAQARLKLGLAYLGQSNLEKARFNMSKALEYAPDDYRTHLGMALYEQQIGEYHAVENRYQRAFELAPGNGAVLNNYGAFLCHLGQYNKAQQQFSISATSSDYKYVADSLENAGYCFLQEGQMVEAKSFLNRALVRAPDKSKYLLLTTERYIQEHQYSKVKVLLEAYEQALPKTAESLWLQLRFAALEDRRPDVKRYGALLAKNFSQSEQYQQFLANEY